MKNRLTLTAEDLRRLKRENERLKGKKFEFIFLNEGRWPVSEMCAALGATRQGHCAWKGRLHPAPAMDMWSRRIVGWAMGPSITAELADEALKMTLARRNDPRGCVHHSDHGARYASLLPSKTVRERGVRPSMGSISSPWDNAAMEPLIGIVKSECVHTRACATRDEAVPDIFEYIEAVCNRARTHSAPGYMSPAESEKANWPDAKGRPKAA